MPVGRSIAPGRGWRTGGPPPEGAAGPAGRGARLPPVSRENSRPSSSRERNEKRGAALSAAPRALPMQKEKRRP